MTGKTNGDVATTVDFGGGIVNIGIAKKDLAKIKEYVKSHKYTNKTVLRLEIAGIKNPVRMVLQAHNETAPASEKRGNGGNVV